MALSSQVSRVQCLLALRGSGYARATVVRGGHLLAAARDYAVRQAETAVVAATDSKTCPEATTR